MTQESRKERRKREREQEKLQKKAEASRQRLESELEDQSDTPKKLSIRIGSVFVFILPFVIYYLTLFRTVPPSDAGELIAGAHELGVLHPPGFPVYVVLGWLFDHLPVGSSAFRLNLMSAFFNCATYSLIYLVLARALKNLWIPFLPILGFAFTNTVWFYSVSAEFFAVNHFFIALLFYCSFKFFTLKSEKWVLIGSFAFGLGLANHQVLLFYGLPLALVAGITHADLFNPKLLFKSLAMVVLGLLPYLLLFSFSKGDPYVNWGEIESVSDLLRHILRQEYGTFQLTQNGEEGNLFQALYYFLRDSVEQGFYILTPLAFLGMAYVWKNRKQNKFAFAWFVSLVFFVIVFHTMVNKSWEETHTFIVMTRFWQQANLIFWIFSGWALFYLVRRWQVPSSKRNLALGLGVGAAILLVIPFQFSQNDQSQNNRYELYGKWLLQSLPKNSILLLDGDTEINITRYLQVCEDIRPDLVVLEKNLLRSQWFTDYVRRKKSEVKIPGSFYHPTRKDAGAYQHKAFFDANIERPIFVSHLGEEGSKEAEDQSWIKDYYLKPFGPFSRVFPKTQNANTDLDHYVELNEKIFTKFDIPLDDEFISQPRIQMMRDLLVRSRYQIGLWLIGGEGADQRPESSLLHGVKIVERIIETEPQFPHRYYTVIAAGYQKLAQKNDKYRDKLIHTLEDYLKSNPPDGAEKNRARAIIRMAQEEN